MGDILREMGDFDGAFEAIPRLPGGGRNAYQDGSNPTRPI